MGLKGSKFFSQKMFNHILTWNPNFEFMPNSSTPQILVWAFFYTWRFRGNLIIQLCKRFENMTLCNRFMTFSADFNCIFKMCHEGYPNVLSKLFVTLSANVGRTYVCRTFLAGFWWWILLFQTFPCSLPKISIESNDSSSCDIWR